MRPAQHRPSGRGCSRGQPLRRRWRSAGPAPHETRPRPPLRVGRGRTRMGGLTGHEQLHPPARSRQARAPEKILASPTASFDRCLAISFRLPPFVAIRPSRPVCVVTCDIKAWLMVALAHQWHTEYEVASRASKRAPTGSLTVFLHPGSRLRSSAPACRFCSPSATDITFSASLLQSECFANVIARKSSSPLGQRLRSDQVPSRRRGQLQ